MEGGEEKKLAGVLPQNGEKTRGETPMKKKIKNPCATCTWVAIIYIYIFFFLNPSVLVFSFSLVFFFSLFLFMYFLFVCVCVFFHLFLNPLVCVL